MSEQYYSSDAPVNTPEEDQFARWPFAKRVADVIAKRNDPSSIVIGLYGAWGEGKTSVLNFIDKSFEENENIVCLRFNPWRYGNEEQLLEGFFLDIADAIDTKIISKQDEIKKAAKKALPSITSLLGNKEAGVGIAQFLKGPTLVDLKHRIEEALQQAKKRVVILVDDIDRLENDEIHAIFRLVKLTADFKYTAYLLAFDESVVASALQERYSADSKNAGRSFLEKIIQVPLHLPYIDTQTIKKFCFQSIDEALKISNIELNDQEVQEYVRDFTYAFESQLKTPRKAKLYGNILLFSLPILKGEVNPIDLMLIEGIRVFYPKLYNAIKKHHSLFAGVFSESIYTNNDDEKNKIKDIIDDSLSAFDAETKKGVISLLESMFPKLQAVYGNMTFGNDWTESWYKAQRICSSAYFKRYFAYAVPHDDISDQVIQNIIEQAISSTQKSVSKILEELITDNNVEKVINKLRIKAKELAEQPSINLATAIATCRKQFPNPQTMFDYTNPFSQAAMLINDLLRNIKDKAIRVEHAKNIIKESIFLNFSMEIFRWLDRKNEEKPEKDAFSDEEIDCIVEPLVKKINDETQNNENIISKYPNECERIFYIWKKYKNQDVEKYLEKLFVEVKKSVFMFLENYTPTAWGMESGISHKSDFKRDQYDSVVRIIKPSIIINAMKKDLGSLPETSDEYPHFSGDSREIKLAKQFMWLHAHVNNETEDSNKKNS